MLGISELKLGFFFIEAFLDFQIATYFIYDYFFKKNGSKTKFSLLAFTFLFLGFSKCTMIYNDYYLTTESPLFNYVYLIGIGLAIIGIIFLAHISERMLPFNTRHLVAITGIILFLITYTLPLILGFSLDYLRMVYYIIFPSLFIFIFTALFVLFLRTIGIIRRYIGFIICGLFIFGLGRAFNTEYMKLIFGDIINLYGSIIIVVGLALIGLGFRALPSLNELEWHNKIYNLYIIYTKNGVCLFRHSFQPKSMNESVVKIDDDLLTGGLTGVMHLIKEMLYDEDDESYMKTIDHMDVKILLERGHYVTGIIIAKEELKIISDKLDQFIKLFENRNIKYLKKFDGNVSRFEKDIDLVHKIFEIKNKKINK